MDDKQTVGMSAREGLAAFTAFAKHIKDKPMWLGEGQPMASKLDSIKQRLDELTEATAALNKQLNAEVEDLGAESQLWDWRDTCRQKIANNAPDDLRALLAVAESCEKIVNGGDSGGWEWVEVSRKDFDELKAALATLTG